MAVSVVSRLWRCAFAAHYHRRDLSGPSPLVDWWCWWWCWWWCSWWWWCVIRTGLPLLAAAGADADFAQVGIQSWGTAYQLLISFSLVLILTFFHCFVTHIVIVLWLIFLPGLQCRCGGDMPYKEVHALLSARQTQEFSNFLDVKRGVRISQNKESEIYNFVRRKFFSKIINKNQCWKSIKARISQSGQKPRWGYDKEFPLMRSMS